MKKNTKFIYCGLAIISLILIILACIKVRFENDTFYSIKIGEDILKYGIDFKDHYSWINNLSYTYPHWLFDIIVYLIYNNFSFNGIFAFTILAYFLIGVSEYLCLKNISKNKLLSYTLTIITVILIRNNITCRAQILTYILTIIFYFSLLKLTKTNNKKYIIVLSLISCLIVNLHVAFWPFIFLLFLPFFAEKIIYKFFSKKIKIKKYIDKFKLKPLIISFISCIFSGLITPLKLIPYTYLYNTIKGASQSYIAEHLPIVLWNNKLLLIYIFLIIIILHNKKIKLNDLFLICGLLIMMLSSIRHAALFVILIPFVIVKYYKIPDSILKEKKNYLNPIILLSILAIFVYFPCIDLIKDKIKNDDYFSGYPVNAVKYIKQNIDYKNIKILNEYNYGSYLLFNNLKVMFDSRADLYTKEFNKKYEYFTEFMEINIINYEEIIKKYNINYALIYKSSSLNSVMKHNDTYEEIYSDKDFILYKIL